FGAQRQLQAEFMSPAAAAGDVDVISAYTSDGRIAQYSLKVLVDPRQALPPYDAILLLASKRADDPRVLHALQPLVGAISVETMREANLRTSTGESPEDAARWLATKMGRRSRPLPGNPWPIPPTSGYAAPLPTRRSR